MENTGRKNNDSDGNVGMGQPDDNGFVRPFVQPRGRRPFAVVFLLVALGAVVAAFVYFALYQTGHIHVTREFSDGSIFSGYWRMGEPFGEGVLVTSKVSSSRVSGMITGNLIPEWWWRRNLRIPAD